MNIFIKYKKQLFDHIHIKLCNFYSHISSFKKEFRYLNYIYKYAYYYKNVKLITFFCEILSWQNSDNLDFSYIHLILGFLDYLKKKKTTFCIKCEKKFTNFTKDVPNVILFRYVSGNLPIFFHNFDDIMKILKLYYKYNLSYVDIKNPSMNTITDICCHMYEYFNKCIKYSKLDFNSIISLFDNLDDSIYSNRIKLYKYSFVGIFTILYCIKNKNNKILNIFANYINDIFNDNSISADKKSKTYFIFNIISSITNYTDFIIVDEDCINNNNDIRDNYNYGNKIAIVDRIIFKKINNNDLKLLFTKKYFNIIEKLINNHLFYDTIFSNIDYITINKIINIKNPSKIDKIVIKNIYNSNILNTIEYNNCINKNK